jgi:hypothetical protein
MSFYENLPAALQEIVQNGLLTRAFEDALVPLFLFDNLAEIREWGGQMGSQAIFTRNGLMDPVPNPVTGSDAPQGTYGFEQFSLFMDQYGNSIDTNMAISAEALASKFLKDNKVLGTNAAQTLNRIARGALYGAYAGGRTYATAASTTSVDLVVNDVAGFSYAPVTLPSQTGNTEGINAASVPQLQPVSAANPLSVTVNGVANTVTGVDVSTSTLVLGTAVSAAIGWDVVASNAPVSYRPGAAVTGNDLTSSSIATLSLFQNAVTRLRSMNVPMINGAYVAHVHPQTFNELFQDQNFLLAYRGQAESPVYKNLAVGSEGRFAGIDWVMDTEVPYYTNVAGLTVYQPIVAGDECLIKGPFSEMGSLVNAVNAGSTVQIEMLNGVARILRAPLDRFGQVLSSTWSWIGGYSVGTDMLTGDAAAFKRAVLVEHV